MEGKLGIKKIKVYCYNMLDKYIDVIKRTKIECYKIKFYGTCQLKLVEHILLVYLYSNMHVL